MARLFGTTVDLDELESRALTIVMDIHNEDYEDALASVSALREAMVELEGDLRQFIEGAR